MGNGEDHVVPSPTNVQENEFDESRLLTLLQQLETQTPSIPDKVLEEIMSSKGMRTDDVRITRLVALAGQKFLSDILDDVWRLNKLKGSAQNSRSTKNKDKKLELIIYILNFRMNMLYTWLVKKVRKFI